MQSAPKPVKLSSAEYTAAAQVGIQRHVAAVREFRKSSLAACVDTAVAELVVCKHFDRYWHAGEFKLTAGAEVKACYIGDGKGGVPVQDDDDADCVLVAVAGLVPTFYVVGWIRAGFVRVDKWRNKECLPAAPYIVPVGDLNPVETLPR
jgi:hypothetical protein